MESKYICITPRYSAEDYKAAAYVEREKLNAIGRIEAELIAIYERLQSEYESYESWYFRPVEKQLVLTVGNDSVNEY